MSLKTGLILATHAWRATEWLPSALALLAPLSGSLAHAELLPDRFKRVCALLLKPSLDRSEKYVLLCEPYK